MYEVILLTSQNKTNARSPLLRANLHSHLREKSIRRIEESGEKRARRKQMELDANAKSLPEEQQHFGGLHDSWVLQNNHEEEGYLVSMPRQTKGLAGA